MTSNNSLRHTQAQLARALDLTPAQLGMLRALAINPCRSYSSRAMLRRDCFLHVTAECLMRAGLAMRWPGSFRVLSTGTWKRPGLTEQGWMITDAGRALLAPEVQA